MKLFVVGRIHDWSLATGFPAWELLGVFTDEQSARLACVERDDFVFPIDAGIAVDDATGQRAFYPIREIDGERSH